MSRELLECFDPSDLKLNSLNRSYRGPRSLQDIIDAKYLILAHCTSSVFLDNIKKEGIIPDLFQERCKEDNLPSDNKCVYLLSRVDKLYADSVVNTHGGEALFVVVRVELTSLEADENTITPNLKKKNLPQIELLFRSLNFGQCKHRGLIPPSQILGIYKTDGTKFGEHYK